jgi:hypothetical protein
MERDFLSLITSHLLASEVINVGMELAEICRYPNTRILNRNPVNLKDMYFTNFSKMMPVNCKCNGQRHQPGALAQGP